MVPAAPPTWRLFLGLWPGDAERQALLAHAERWAWAASARRTRPEQLHVTLHFIGSVPATRMPQLLQGLRVGWEGCVLEWNAARVWPGGIAVLEADAVPAPLAALHARLADALLALGLPVEPRPFRPHVTLARHAKGSRPPADFTPLRWAVGPRYVLVRSLPGGAGYAPLESFG